MIHLTPSQLLKLPLTCAAYKTGRENIDEHLDAGKYTKNSSPTYSDTKCSLALFDFSDLH